MSKFTQIDRPYLYGFEAEREDGVTVEVVRCFESEWNVFLTRDAHVVACSVEEYRRCRHGYLPKKEAMEIAKALL